MIVMLSSGETVYEIRYDFDLDGKEIIIPENCILHFKGGSLKNGTIVGASTMFQGFPKIFASPKGSFVGTPSIKWFLKNYIPSNDKSYASNEDVQRAMSFANQFDSKCLDFENVYTFIKGSILFTENTNISIVNANILFEPEKEKDFLFSFDSNRVWTGTTSIDSCKFSCYNPNNFKGVGVIHFIRWYNTAGWAIKNIRCFNFNGYFMVNETYLQEGIFSNIDCNGTNGFMSFNTDLIYGTKKGSSNVISYINCYVNNASNTVDPKYVPYVNDFYNIGIAKFLNCVFQGVGSQGVKSTKIGGDTGFSVANYVSFDTYWMEMTNGSFINNLDLNFGVYIEFKGQSNFSNINVNHNGVTLDLKNVQVQSLRDILNVINVKEGITRLSVIADSALKGFIPYDKYTERFVDFLEAGVLKEANNSYSPWREDSLNFSVSFNQRVDGIFNALNKDKIRSYLSQDSKKKSSLIDIEIDNEKVPILQLETLSNESVYFPAIRSHYLGELAKTFRSTCSTLLFFRMAPTVDVTEENIKDCYVSSGLFNGNSANWGAINTVYFDVGSKANQFTEWKKIITVGYNDNTSGGPGFNLKNCIMQIGKLEFAGSKAYFNDDVYPSSTNADKLVKVFNDNYLPVLKLSNYGLSSIGGYIGIIKSTSFIYLFNNELYLYDKGKDTFKKIITEYIDAKRSGTLLERQSLSNMEVGFSFFDTSINKPIWWNGKRWVDSMGNEV